MGIIKNHPKGFPFCAVMYNNPAQLQMIEKQLINKLGKLIGKGIPYRVTNFTDYYVKEFGRDLKKQFFVFQEPVDLEEFYKIKIWSNLLETELEPSGTESRTVNIDPGYLKPSKLILFSTKNFSHRIYCGSGIFAEVTMSFAHGDYIRLPWTYDDYYDEKNRRFLLEMRSKIVNILRR